MGLKISRRWPATDRKATTGRCQPQMPEGAPGGRAIACEEIAPGSLPQRCFGVEPQHAHEILVTDDDLPGIRKQKAGRIILAESMSLGVARKPVVQQKLATEIVPQPAHVIRWLGLPAKHMTCMFPILETELRADYIESVVQLPFRGHAQRHRLDIQRA